VASESGPSNLGQSELGQRRPIKAREFALSRAIAHWLAARGVDPNTISIVGLCSALLAGAILGLTDGRSVWSWVFAALCVELRLLCNMFDGMVAVERGIASKLGEIYNEVPDRIADIGVLVGLGYAAGSTPWLGYVAALAALFTAYIRVFGVSLGAPADFSGIMAKQFRMHTVALAALACAGALLVGIDYRAVFASLGLPTIALIMIAVGAIGTSLRRLSHLVGRLK
jgi:phosphatidylglycerophosphate synthase